MPFKDLRKIDDNLSSLSHNIPTSISRFLPFHIGVKLCNDIIFGNDGNVSTPASITIMTYLDPLDSLDPANAIYDETGKPVYFDFLPPSEGEESAWHLWSYEVPGETEEGEYKITIVIDADENNTDDSILDNNSAEWPICIGDCTVPDLVVHDMGGPGSISPDPPEAVAGDIVTFSYSIENIGDGMAKRDNGFVMHLEVMKCLGTGEDPCLNQSDWVKVNHTTRTMPPIISGGVFTSMDLNLFSIVPVLSSAARIPFPSATM